MAVHFESVSLPGFASWMKKQADEERSHGMRLWEHVYDRGGKVELKTIEQPPAAFGTPLEVFQHVLEHEQKVTGSSSDLAAFASRLLFGRSAIFFSDCVSMSDSLQSPTLSTYTNFLTLPNSSRPDCRVRRHSSPAHSRTKRRPIDLLRLRIQARIVSHRSCDSAGTADPRRSW
jgi:hypothetical protein